MALCDGGFLRWLLVPSPRDAGRPVGRAAAPGLMDPEQRLIGKWKADSSAAGVAMKAAKLKADNPEISGADATAYARSLTNVSLDLNKDKSCAFVTGGNTLKGTWKFDKEAKIVELDLQTAEIAPENKDKNPEGFKPQTYIAIVEEGGTRSKSCRWTARATKS